MQSPSPWTALVGVLLMVIVLVVVSWVAGFVVQLRVNRYGLNCHPVAISRMPSKLDGWALAHRLSL